MLFSFTQGQGGLQPNDQVTASHDQCSIVTPYLVLKGELLIAKNNFYFKHDALGPDQVTTIAPCCAVGLR